MIRLMNTALHSALTAAAELVHSRHAGDFVLVNDRWYARIQVDGDWGWTHNGARERLAALVPALADKVSPDPQWFQLRYHLTTTWGQRQIVGRAAALFRASYLPAPAPAPELPAPEAGS